MQPASRSQANAALVRRWIEGVQSLRLRAPAAVLVWSGLLALVLGLGFYAACRPLRPWLLAFLEPGPTVPACQLLAAGWWPSFLHAFAFTCLLAACLGASRRWAGPAAGFWVAVAAIAELACVGGVLRGSTLIMVGGLSCQPDLSDVLAAVFGAALAVLIASPGPKPASASASRRSTGEQS